MRDARNRRLLNVLIGAWPPALGTITFQDAICHRGLRRFRYNVEADSADEPADWNRARRMWGAGVRFAFFRRPVTEIHFAPVGQGSIGWRDHVVTTRGYIGEPDGPAISMPSPQLRDGGF